MRRTALLTLVVLAACGGDQDPVVDGVATTSTTASAGVVATAPGDTTATPALTDTTAADGGGGASAPSGETSPTTSLQAPVESARVRPAAGSYAFHTTGTNNNNAVDRNDQTVIEALSDTDTRETVQTPDGGQVSVLRYLPDQVQLLSLDVTAFGQTRHFDGPVLFAPMPPAGSWEWELTSADGSTRLRQRSTAVGPEAVTVPAGAYDTIRVDTTISFTQGLISGTIELQTWASTTLRTGVRAHQVTRIGGSLISDTTTELTGFTPA